MSSTETVNDLKLNLTRPYLIQHKAFKNSQFDSYCDQESTGHFGMEEQSDQEEL